MVLRIVRVVLGAVLAIVGLALLAAGGVAAIGLVGPDDTLTSAPTQLRTKGAAIATQPDLLRYYGPTLRVRVESNDPDRGVFVGVGHDVDVASYLADSTHARLYRISVPFNPEAADVEGERNRLARPQPLDWWVASGAGKRAAELTWTLADGPYDVVILSTDGRGDLDVSATFSIEVDGLFGTLVLVAVGGLLLLVLGLFLILVGWLRKRRESESDLDGEGLFATSAAGPRRGPGPGAGPVPGSQAGRTPGPERVGTGRPPGPPGPPYGRPPDPSRGPAPGPPTGPPPDWPGPQRRRPVPPPRPPGPPGSPRPVGQPPQQPPPPRRQPPQPPRPDGPPPRRQPPPPAPPGEGGR